MIYGLGNDIIEIERLAKAIDRHGQPFLDKLFTAQEQAYCQRHKFSPRHYAGRFAAKEAIAKALGTGFREGVSWLDIEIINDHHGKPEASLSPALSARFNNPQLMLSISHCQTYATAVAIVVAG